jgi:hypothetical protein
VRDLLGDVGGRSGDEVLEVLRVILADHTITRPASEVSPEADRAAGVSSCCVHTEEYGTRSSMIVRDAHSPQVPPDVWASEGPSCVNPLTKAAFAL